MKQHKLKILLFTDWYTPGYKAGGPIQSCQNLVSYFKEESSFFILTSDTDLGDDSPYNGIPSNIWTTGKAGEQVFYAKKNFLNFSSIKRIIKEVEPDLIYFNSMFSFKYTITPIAVIKLMAQNPKIVLAPRGMLHTGALSLKSSKKTTFLKLFKLLGLNKGIRFHATDSQELTDINHYFPKNIVVLAKNVPNLQIAKRDHFEKQPNSARLIFVSRLHPKKNLTYFLGVLNAYKFEGQISLDIFGATDSEAYLLECKNLVRTLAPNIKVDFFGSIPNQTVVDKLQQYDTLILPTLGENFGHVIFEALMGGVPVLISDQTPWRSLSESKAGWDIPLNDPELYKDALQSLIKMDYNEYILWSEGARNRAESYLNTSAFKTDYQKLFNV